MNIKNRVVRTARGIAAAIKNPPYFAPGGFYSSNTSWEDRERAVEWGTHQPVGIDLRPEQQFKLAHEIGLSDPFPIVKLGPRYRALNDMYAYGDASALYCMLRHFRPKRMVEVGSGFSTAVTLDAADQFLPDLQLTCIEPHAERLRARLLPKDEIHIVEKPVQDVGWAFSDLEAGDFLFIDSTHVVKSGSDVVWLYLHVLPRLPPGVIVHVHDVFWPFEYPSTWVREGRDWTELYLLRAFLTNNEAWEIVLMTDWLYSQPDTPVTSTVRSEANGSLWMQRRL